MADYRKILKDHIQESGNWTGHPWTQIDMQIHHLISKKGYSLSKFSKRLEKKITNADYDIDVAENLVALPSEYRGACHLEVQLHKGNHPKHNGKTYHKRIAGYIDEQFEDIKNDKLCGNHKKVQDDMNDISEDILELIKDFILPLTTDGIYLSFKEKEKSGCRNLPIGGKKKQFSSKVKLFKTEGNKSINDTCCTTDNRTKYRSDEEKIKILDFISKKRRGAHYDVKTPHTLKVGN